MPTPLQARRRVTQFPAADFPPHLPAFVYRVSAWDQAWLVLLSLTVSVLDTAPIEIQRRIINGAIGSRDFTAILWLALIYLGLVAAEGLTKLVMNVYRGWIAENAIRVLRSSVNAIASTSAVRSGGTDHRGVEVAMILSEAEPVGGFVGDSVSEPILQAGILGSVAVYLAYLHPTMALASLVAFLPQLIFVPLVQSAINRRVRMRINAMRATSAGAIDASSEAVRLAQEARFQEVFTLNMGVFELKYTLNFFMNLLTHMGLVGVLTLGGWYVVHGQMEVGTVVAFVAGLRNVTDPWGSLVNWFANAWVTSAKYELMRATLAAAADTETEHAP